MIRVFLAGEGPSELGSRSGHPVYQTDAQPGVIQALLGAVRPDGWEVAGAINWKDIRKLRVKTPDQGDARNVHAASVHAAESGATVLAFARDRDGEPSRTEDIERAIAEATNARAVQIVGGVAVEAIEAWLIALTGEARSENVRYPENEMPRLGLEPKSCVHYAAHVEAHALAKVAPDAHSLGRWLTRARAALAHSASDGSST